MNSLTSDQPARTHNPQAARRIIILLLFIFLVSAFLAFQSRSRAQTTSCPGNLLQNGDFAINTVVGSGDFPPSTVANWSAAFLTPQISALTGCGNAGFIRMWGNKVVGEGIKQTVNIQAGKTYKLSLCARVDTSNPLLPNYVRVNVRAGTPAYAAPPSSATIGLTSNITSTTWTSITLPNWTAPTAFSTITINPENDNIVNNGNTVSWVWLDNVCIQEVVPPDFTATVVCQGQPTTFNASSATSWDWDFGDSTPHGTQQNPTHTYANWGAFNAKLCINGTTNCVTHAVIVHQAPPVPVITGPPNVFTGQTATYTVPVGSGVSYSWSVTNGTINGPSSGATLNSINVTWTGSSGGSVTVTVTNGRGCASTATLNVRGDTFLGDCCLGFKSKTDLGSFSHAGGGVYNFTPTLSVNMSGVIRVTATVLSSSLTFSPASCGTAGPVNSYVVGATNVGGLGGLTGTVTIPNGDEAMWHGPPTNVNGLAFPMQIKFPPPPASLKCTDALTFCVKYTFTTVDCKTCEVIRCYGPFKRGGIKEADEIKIITKRP